MNTIKQIASLNATELEKVVPSNASWHTDYRDTAYIHIGGLPFELSEGDILTLFSQYGNPVYVNLIRDKDTGKSRGFGFLKYEDQRSCDLAVDNLSGAQVLGRVLSVDHTRYKRKEGEGEEIPGEEVEEAAEADTEAESDEERPLIKGEIELQKLLREHDEDDPMKAYMVEEKKKEVAEALRGVVARKDKGKEGERRHKHRHHSRRHDEDGERKDDRHRSRRDEKDRDDEGKHRSHRSHHSSRRERSRSADPDERRSHKPRRERSRSPGSERKHRSRRDASPSDDERPRRRREERRRSEDERSRSREPYRRP